MMTSFINYPQPSEIKIFCVEDIESSSTKNSSCFLKASEVRDLLHYATAFLDRIFKFKSEKF